MNRVSVFLFMLLLLAACTDDSKKGKNCENRAQLIENVTTPASSGIMPGSVFTKTWHVRNTGTCTWDNQYHVAKRVGEFISAEPPRYSVATTPPDGEYTVTLTLRLSEQARMNVPQSASFQLHTPENQPFGPVLQVQVVVGRPISTTAPTPTRRVTPIPTPVPAGVVPSGSCLNNAQFVADVTIPDGASVAPGQPFVKIWRFKNTGTCPWNNTYSITKTQGDTILMTGTAASLPSAPPGMEVDISVTLTVALGTPIGTQQIAVFELRTPTQQAFGDPPYVQVTVSGSSGVVSTSAACTNGAAFVSDVTLPDNAVIGIGQTYVKTWRLRNTGTCPWNANYVLVKVLGEQFSAETVHLPPVDPGQEADISVNITLSPSAVIGQRYMALFSLRAPNGDSFGDQPYVQVIVGQ